MSSEATRRKRLACHGNTVCCQYVDQPMCNSRKDPHLRGRLHYWYLQVRLLVDEWRGDL